MESTDDSALLRQYADGHSDEAFAALVARHINLVYSVARRQVGNPQHAEEIVQAVFIILATKACSLRHDHALSSWLFQTTRLTANNFIRSEARRHRREQEAYMQTVLREDGEELSPQIVPWLDDAVAALGETDRRAIVLRFYEGRNLREVGAALGTNEETAKKRVARALDKLQRFFQKRGINSTTAILAGAMSANSVSAAPVALAKTVTAVALAKGATAPISTLTLIKGALKIMAWTKAKTAAVAVIGFIFATGTTTLVVKHIATKPAQIPGTAIDDSFFEPDSRMFKAPAGLVILRPSHFAKGGQMGSNSDGKTTRLAGKKVSLVSVIGMAYNAGDPRIVMPADFPQGTFDFLVTVPEQPWEKLQAEIRRQFGLVGRQEMRETNAWLLVTGTPGASGLKRSVGGNPVMGANGGQVYWHNQPISALAGFLEEQFNGEFRRPVIDRSGLKGNYDFALEMNALDSVQNLKRALLNQLGLELVPGREPVEMVVVEKVK